MGHWLRYFYGRTAVLIGQKKGIGGELRFGGKPYFFDYMGIEDMTAVIEDQSPADKREKLLYRRAEAQIRKLNAEAEGIDLDNQLKRGDSILKEIEIRKNRAYAKAAEEAAEMQRLQTQQAARQEKISLASNYMWHEYRFEEPVYDESVDMCLTQMAIWHRQDPSCDISVTFTSPGGVVTNGMALFDQIAQYSTRRGGTHHMTGIISGLAASMAGILIQAFDERVQMPNAYLMIHQVQSWAEGSLGDLQDKMEYLNQLNDQVADMFIARSGGKVDRAEFDKYYDRRATYFKAERSLELGFIDRIG